MRCWQWPPAQASQQSFIESATEWCSCSRAAVSGTQAELPKTTQWVSQEAGGGGGGG